MSSNAHPAALYQLRKVTRIAALVILTLVVVGVFLPSEFKVERSVNVLATKNRISDLMFDGEYLSKWMFIQNGQVNSFEGVLQEGDSIGLSYSESDDLGVLQVKSIDGDSYHFTVQPKPSLNLVQNTISLQEQQGVTLVTWTIEGHLSAGLLGPYLAFFANDIAGENFEKSLQRLKVLLED